MLTERHKEIAGKIWEIANRLRGPYRPPQYRLVMLPMVVLRRLDCVLEPTKDAVLAEYTRLQAAGTPATAVPRLLSKIVDVDRKQPLYNTSSYTFQKLLGDSENIAPNLVAYINGFSDTARRVFERFKFGDQIEKLDSSNRLYAIVQAMAGIDLHPDRIGNIEMGYLFEHLIMRFNEQANEEAGDHFTPREVIRLMTHLVYTGEKDVYKPGVYREIYDPACGTGGMLSVSEETIRAGNSSANLGLYGQDYSDEAWAICCSDMLIKDEETDHIVLGDTLGDGKTSDGFPGRQFHYMLANPPFGVEWKDQQKVVEREAGELGFSGRFGAGLPAINDGSLLFLQHMISKMKDPPAKGGEGSKIAIIFNGSPLFSGDAGSGPSNIRRWIIENDWLDARREAMIFPRYHQLDSVRKLIAHARHYGPGRNYLIQHSAGSGKSNSIAWLAHRLASLHDAADAKVFDSVIVITDRRVLDQQLQNTVYQFEHKTGVVEKIDENTQQLAKALAGGVPIVISTIQKFPFISQAIRTLENKGEGVALNTAGKRFAVIVDEAHSSQSGESVAALKGILNKDGIADAIAAQLSEEEDDELSQEAKAAILKEVMSRARQPNLSFFAFTATPKFKTKAVFDEPGPSGASPFHEYSMRQAIEEGFILDVLQNYTTYKRFFGLVKQIENDPEVPKKAAAKALGQFLELHPVNIEQVVQVIIEHFRLKVMHELGGRAKAMVVTGSRLSAVKYKQAFDRYIKDKGYTGIRALVAFSGTVEDPDLPGSTFTEVSMNDGLPERELPERFAGEEFRVLIVAEKYQTGFDQPLLQTMYVVKKLAGVQAVQTLSRLNRIAPGKTRSFVLDFRNEEEDIFKAFKPYYETTPIGDNVDPQKLNELHHKLLQPAIFTPQDVTDFAAVWFKARRDPSGQDHKQMNAILDRSVARFEEREEPEQEEFRGYVTAFRNLYGFLSQILPYFDEELEQLYAFVRNLASKLPLPGGGAKFTLDDDVALKFFRLQQMSEGAIPLFEGEPEPLKGPTDLGTGREKDTNVALSTLVQQLNERFGTDFTEADQLFFDSVRATAERNEKVVEAAKANTEANFSAFFERMLDDLFIQRMEGNEEIFNRVMTDKQFRAAAQEHLARELYDRIRSGEEDH